MTRSLSALLSLAVALGATAAPFTLTSPDGRIKAVVSTGKTLEYSVSYDGLTVLCPSEIGMTLNNGQQIGPGDAKLVGRDIVDKYITSPFYRRSEVRERYNAMTLSLGKSWEVQFRAYDDGVAYRFAYSGKKPLEVKDETAIFSFPDSAKATVPFVRARKYENDFESQFFSSFENIYTVTAVGSLDPQRLIFLPMAVEPARDVNVLITESDLRGYPGMYHNGTA